MLQLDLCGRPCPEPVLEVRRALMEHSELEVLLDSETSVANVSRLARSSDCSVEERQEDSRTLLLIRKQGDAAGTAKEAAPVEAARPQTKGKHVLVLSADTMGRGDEELGQLLMRSFLATLREIHPLPDRVILYNTAVRLAVRDSRALADLRELTKAGVDLLACGTCLKHFGLTEQLALGRVSNMYEIAEEVLSASRLSSV